MHMHMFSHAHADPTWTPPFLHGLVPSSMDSTDCGPNRPVDQYKTRAFSPLSMLLRAVSTLDLNSTRASPLSTRPACLPPSIRESYIESIRHSTRRNFKCMRGRGSMGLVNIGVFRGVETHRGVKGDDCASSLTTCFFSQVFLQRNPGRAGLGCKISGLRSGGMMPRARRG